MKISDFNTMLQRRIEKMKSVLSSKGREYASNEDRLEDFRAIARISGVPIGDVWKVLQAKHLVSVHKMLDGRLRITPEMIDEKVGDSMNYHPLVEAILTEQAEMANCINGISTD